MSTDSADTTAKKPPLSSKGDVLQPNPANLEQRQQQQQRIDTGTTSRPQHDKKAHSPSKWIASTADQSAVSSDALWAQNPVLTAGTTTGRETRQATSERGGAPGLDEGPPRQVIAVSASKSPAAFFNLARKFLVSNEVCDLSALEGAIVSAVDAAHLLERSKLAKIVRIQTSYVTVEPKRKKHTIPHQQEDEASVSVLPSSSESTKEDASVARAGGRIDSEKGNLSTPENIPPPHHEVEAGSSSILQTANSDAATATATATATTSQRTAPRSSTGGGRELRRARIVITVRRTENYKQWLEENPLQAMIASEGGDGGEEIEDVDADDEDYDATGPTTDAAASTTRSSLALSSLAHKGLKEG